MEDVARDDAREQDQRLDRDQHAREHLDDAPDRALDRIDDSESRADRTGLPQRGRRLMVLEAGARVHIHAGGAPQLLQLSPPSTARHTPVM